MKVKIIDVTTLNELDDYWTNQDYANLLKLFDFPDVETIKPKDLKEMLCMAITDFEPSDAAAEILKYKMSDALNEGQIQSISHEMLQDKIAEEYPKPELHYDLFNINQLLYKAFNGVFPNTEATLLKIEIVDDDNIDISTHREILSKIIGGGLTERSLVKRLFSDQLDGSENFEDADSFIWRIKHSTKNQYEILTSKYWIDKEDIISKEYEVKVELSEEE